MGQGDPRVLSGMNPDEVKSILGEPNRIHVLNVGSEILTSWIYHAEPDPLCVWFDMADRVKMTSQNCVAKPAVA